MDNTNRNENNTLPVFTLMRRVRISNTLWIFILSGHARHYHIVTKFAKYAKQESLKYVILVARYAIVVLKNVILVTEIMILVPKIYDFGTRNKMRF